jgi:hypothetical protein
MKSPFKDSFGGEGNLTLPLLNRDHQNLKLNGGVVLKSRIITLVSHCKENGRKYEAGDMLNQELKWRGAIGKSKRHWTEDFEAGTDINRSLSYLVNL